MQLVLVQRLTHNSRYFGCEGQHTKEWEFSCNSCLARTVCRPYTAALRDSAVSSSRSASNLQRVHVAAVCYRVRCGEPEFLLVRTRNGHWTFPKGRVDQDATNADAAAREAFEEAGVRGSVEPTPFVCYRHCKPRRPGSRGQVVLVDAHLCKVKHVAPPLEVVPKPDVVQRAESKATAAEVLGR